nr:ribonuclease H-like domain-containing protein [Tanacetum cinerariifolium]
MTRNKSYLTDYQEIDGGFLLHLEEILKELLDESQVLLKVPRNNNMYSFNLKNVVPLGGLTCLFAKATLDESKLWHIRIGHTNFKTMNKLVRRNIVRGLPSKLFENDHTCVACQKDKQHKASCIENQIDHKVKTIRCDNEIEFKNRIMNKFCEIKVNTACYVQNRVLVIKPRNKTPYELFLGKKPALSFMRPFGCPVIILNTLDHLGNQTNGNAGAKANIDAGQARKKTVPGLQYVLLPLFTSNFQGTKSSEDEVPDDARKKSIKVPRKENGEERAQRNEFKNLFTDPCMPNLEDIVDLQDTGIFSDAYVNEVKGAMADFNNLELTTVVSHIPITRIHKDHPKEKIIRDPLSAPQTRRMIKTSQEHDMMDMKSAFLYGIIEEEVYVCQPLSFEDPHFPDKSMMMVQYLTFTDHALWEVIVNGDSVSPIASASAGAEGLIPPKTDEQKLARKNELKAKSTLMLAIPDENLLKFHACKDAKSLWEAIKNRFEATRNQRRCRRPLSSRIMKTLLHQVKKDWIKPMIDFRSSLVNLKFMNVAFVSLDNTSNTNELVNTAHSVAAASYKDQASTSSYADDVMFSFFSNQSDASQLDNEDLEQVDTDDLEEMDIKWQVAMLTMRVKRRDKTGLGYDGQMNESDLNDIHVDESEVLNNMVDSHKSDGDDNQVNDRFKKVKGYHAVPLPYIEIYMPPRADLSFAGLDNYVFKSKVSETITSVPKIETNASKTSKDSLEEYKTVRSSAPLTEE